jgi:transcription antitermination protein NusB
VAHDPPRRTARALPRHEARRRALHVLYAADLRRTSIGDALEHNDTDPHAERLDDYARGLVEGVSANLAEIDALLDEQAHGWSVARMPLVDRNVLRLGVYELLHADDTPAAVVIDEAVELAKDLSSEESPRFVNGVLSGVRRRRGDERPGAGTT